MTGTIKIARAIFDHQLFVDEPLTEREAWIWMIAEASWKPRKKRVGDYVADLERGQLAASVRFMAGAWKWTPARVQRFLKRLNSLDMIYTKTDTGVSVITVCNYNEYQGEPEASDTGPIQVRYRSDTNEKKDEIREKEEVRTPLPPKGERDVEAALSEVLRHETVEAFIAHRKAKRAKLTLHAAKLIVGKLRECHDPDGTVNRSIMQGWTGVFPEAQGPPQLSLVPRIRAQLPKGTTQ